MLGLREIDTFHPWDQLKVSHNTLDTTPSFINYHRSITMVLQEMNPLCPSRSTFSANQHTTFDIIMHHLQAKEPLKMIIQGTSGTGKSYLIHCVKETLSSQAPFGHSPLFLLAST
jgi:pantothenate kinase-related protein Tda10